MIEQWPFPHLVVHDALAESYFGALADAYPDYERIAGTGRSPNNTLFKKGALEVTDDPKIPEIWREFFARHCSGGFFHEVLDLWQPTLTSLYPGLAEHMGAPPERWTTGVRRAGGERNPENRAEHVQLDCQLVVNSPVRRETSVRGPHVDRHYKLFAAILYFRMPEDDSRGGELEFYRYRDPVLHYEPGRRVPYDFVESSPVSDLKRIGRRHVRHALSIPYRPNTLVMWLNSPYAIHGVSARGVTRWPRRYVNILGECYGGALDGLFAPRARRGLATVLRPRAAY